MCKTLSMQSFLFRVISESVLLKLQINCLSYFNLHIRFILVHQLSWNSRLVIYMHMRATLFEKSFPFIFWFCGTAEKLIYLQTCSQSTNVNIQTNKNGSISRWPIEAICVALEPLHINLVFKNLAYKPFQKSIVCFTSNY